MGPSVVCASACLPASQGVSFHWSFWMLLNPESGLFKSSSVWLAWVRATSSPHPGVHVSLSEASLLAGVGGSPPTFLSPSTWPRWIPAALPPALGGDCCPLRPAAGDQDWILDTHKPPSCSHHLAQATGQEDFVKQKSSERDPPALRILALPFRQNSDLRQSHATL